MNRFVMASVLERSNWQTLAEKLSTGAASAGVGFRIVPEMLQGRGLVPPEAAALYRRAQT